MVSMFCVLCPLPLYHYTLQELLSNRSCPSWRATFILDDCMAALKALMLFQTDELLVGYKWPDVYNLQPN